MLKEKTFDQHQEDGTETEQTRQVKAQRTMEKKQTHGGYLWNYVTCKSVQLIGFIGKDDVKKKNSSRMLLGCAPPQGGSKVAFSCTLFAISL